LLDHQLLLFKNHKSLFSVGVTLYVESTPCLTVQSFRGSFYPHFTLITRAIVHHPHYRHFNLLLFFNSKKVGDSTVEAGRV